MGARKSEMAKKYKAEKQQKAIAVLRDCPTSPRKMRLVADIIRGVEINKALGILRYSKKEASIRVEKLLKSRSPTGKPRILRSVWKIRSCASRRSSSTAAGCSNVSRQLPEVAHTVFASVRIT